MERETSRSSGERAWVALVGPEEEENLGLRHLAASLAAANLDAALLPFNAAEHLGPVVAAVTRAETPPVLVALSLAFQWRAADVLALALALREQGYRGHLTGGGHWGTFTWRELLTDFPELDSVCRHEAEHTLVDLARAVRDGAPLDAIPGLALRDPAGEPMLTGPARIPDVAALPWPDRRGEGPSCVGHGIAALVASRGCYGNCTFCCIAAWHEEVSPGRRWRLRPVEDVADEMVHLQRRHGRDVFIFHDDDFFPPGRRRALERVHALADALEARGMGPFATVVKARPTDVSEEVFRAMHERLGCIRVFLGVETDSLQGLKTLRRHVGAGRNQRAMDVLRDLGIYVCFNMLIFDPDTTLESLEANFAFMEQNGDQPLNFGRVELYAGTPLLARMQAEGRCRGDYTGWDYDLATPEVERVFRLTLRAFTPRNFAAGALANRLMGTRFDVEVARWFHPDHFRAEWLEEAQDLSTALTADSVRALREIVDRVRRGAPADQDPAFLQTLAPRLRTVEHDLGARAARLEAAVQSGTGRRCRHGRPLTWDVPAGRPTVRAS